MEAEALAGKKFGTMALGQVNLIFISVKHNCAQCGRTGHRCRSSSIYPGFGGKYRAAQDEGCLR